MTCWKRGKSPKEFLKEHSKLMKHKDQPDASMKTHSQSPTRKAVVIDLTESEEPQTEESPRQPQPESPTPPSPNRVLTKTTAHDCDGDSNQASDERKTSDPVECAVRLGEVSEESWREEDAYEMSGGLREDDEAVSISSDDNTVCAENNELFFMPNRLVGKMSVALRFEDPVLAWEMIPAGFHISAKALHDTFLTFEDDEARLLTELLRRGGVCREDVAYLEDLEPCSPEEAQESSPMEWGKPWVPVIEKTIRVQKMRSDLDISEGDSGLE